MSNLPPRPHSRPHLQSCAPFKYSPPLLALVGVRILYLTLNVFVGSVSPPLALPSVSPSLPFLSLSPPSPLSLTHSLSLTLYPLMTHAHILKHVRRLARYRMPVHTVFLCVYILSEGACVWAQACVLLVTRVFVFVCVCVCAWAGGCTCGLISS